MSDPFHPVRITDVKNINHLAKNQYGSNICRYKEKIALEIIKRKAAGWSSAKIQLFQKDEVTPSMAFRISNELTPELTSKGYHIHWEHVGMIRFDRPLQEADLQLTGLVLVDFDINKS